MSEPMVTRGDLAGQDMTVPWMLVSGQDISVNQVITRKQKGMILYVNDGSRTVQVPMDLHEAGDLYAALEAHMENVAEAQPITPEERDRLLRKGRQDRILKGSLEAVRDEIAQPILLKRDREDAAEAVREVAEIWRDMDPGPEAAADPRQGVRRMAWDLAAALDRLVQRLP